MLYKKSAKELSEMLRNKEVSSVEITESIYSRISETEEKIGAYVTLTKESALETAKKVDEKIARGEDLQPLEGIPVAVKDNISTKGIRTTCSSKMLENYVPPFDATVVENIKNANLPIIGKLNMDEFAMGSSTETSYFKLTRNPHDYECVPGGSSGGSAASVASGEAILSLGSDTGGSIRQPAAFCGVVGLKPTYGAVSRYGLVAFASSLDQIGEFGRTTEDVALLHNLISGHDCRDATSHKSVPKIQNLENIKNIKIGLPKEYFGDGINPAVKESVLNAVKEFEKNGAEIKEISLPSTEYAINTYYIIASAEASSNLARFDGVKYGYRAKEYENLVDMYEKTRSEGFGDEVQRRIMLGTFVLSSGFYDAYYKKAKIIQKNIASEFENAFKDVDIIATPTTPTTAFKIGQKISDPVTMYYNDVCTVAVNIAGLPAISVPCGKIEGMPVGLQFIGRKFAEQDILNAAFTYEQITSACNSRAVIDPKS